MFKKHEYFFLLINLNETPCTVFDGTKNRHIEKKYDFATECTQQ